jgi:hypothetical protein
LGKGETQDLLVAGSTGTYERWGQKESLLVRGPTNETLKIFVRLLFSPDLFQFVQQTCLLLAGVVSGQGAQPGRAFRVHCEEEARGASARVPLAPARLVRLLCHLR